MSGRALSPRGLSRRFELSGPSWNRTTQQNLTFKASPTGATAQFPESAPKAGGDLAGIRLLAAVGPLGGLGGRWGQFPHPFLDRALHLPCLAAGLITIVSGLRKPGIGFTSLRWPPPTL